VSPIGAADPTVYATKAQARRDVNAYIEGFYNSRRRCSALGYRRPNEVHYSYPRQNWQLKQNHQLHWPESPQQPNGRMEATVRKVVLVNTDEYEKGRRRGEQIQRMQAYYGQQRRRHLYNLGIANIKRLNIIFHAHSEEYWRGYADGLHSRLSSRPS
jgi:hypothetical protein